MPLFVFVFLLLFFPGLPPSSAASIRKKKRKAFSSLYALGPAPDTNIAFRFLISFHVRKIVFVNYVQSS